MFFISINKAMFNFQEIKEYHFGRPMSATFS